MEKVGRLSKQRDQHIKRLRNDTCTMWMVSNNGMIALWQELRLKPGLSPVCTWSFMPRDGKRFVLFQITLDLLPVSSIKKKKKEPYRFLPLRRFHVLLWVNCLLSSYLSFSTSCIILYPKDKYAMKHWKCSAFGIALLNGKAIS